jgi:23S rRNA (guanosine2251-2'-O)-methyltransferase
MGYTAGTADPWSSKALRAGAGGHFRVAVTRLGEGAWHGERTTVATVVSGGVAPSELPAGPYAVLIGDESSGLPQPVVQECDVRLTIPMPGGAESLNAAVTAGIVVYALSQG